MSTLKKLFHRKRDSIEEPRGRRSMEQEAMPSEYTNRTSTGSQLEPDASVRKDGQVSGNTKEDVTNLPIAAQYSSPSRPQYGPEDVSKRLAELELADRTQESSDGLKRQPRDDGEVESSALNAKHDTLQDRGDSEAHGEHAHHGEHEDLSINTFIPRKAVGSGISPASPTANDFPSPSSTGLSSPNSNLFASPTSNEFSPTSNFTPATDFSKSFSSTRKLDGQPAAVQSQDRTEQLSQTGVSRPSNSLSAEEIVRRAKQGDSAHTTVSERIAPAITHETVHKKVHNIKEEVITREIHTHDVYHRIQPVIDVEVLPTRHFLPVQGGGLVEVPEKDVPGRAAENRHWVIAETVSKGARNTGAIDDPKSAKRVPGRDFTAREFSGDEGDEKQWTDERGVERSEKTWVHAPGREELAEKSGQTWPLNMDGSSGRAGADAACPE